MLVYDLETDGLLDELTRVHCLNILDRDTGRQLRFNRGVYDDGTPCRRDGPIEDGVRLLEEAEVYGGHNVIGFDNVVLRKLYDFKPKGRCRDSLVEARLIWTNIYEIDDKAIKQRKRPEVFNKVRMRPHSLEAWGIRLGVLKGLYEGTWEAWTPEMDVYADQDPVVTAALFDKIDSKDWPTFALELENRVAEIIWLQEQHGFLFDIRAAEALLAELLIRRAELEDILRTTFKPWFVPEKYKGQHVVMVPKRDDRKLGRTKDVPFTKVEEVVFNPGSRAHIADRMTKLFGWVPKEFTPTGAPEINETTLDRIDAPEAKLLVEYLTIQKRLGQIGTGDAAWLKKVAADGRLHFRVNTNGAVTGRMTHTWGQAQCPKVKTGPDHKPLLGYAGGWGYECRSLFIVPPGCKLVGTDAEGLELRMLGHYMARFDGGAFIESLIHGDKAAGTDAHTVNQRLIGLRSRDSAKTWVYAYLYGSGNFNLGCIIVDDMSDEQRAAFYAKHPEGDARDKAIVRLGQRARKRIEEGLPALGKLQELVKSKAKRGFLKSLDGRRIHVRSLHSALNALLQGGGAVVMKVALVECYQAFQRMGWEHGREYAFVANVHDEFQKETLEQHAETAGKTAAWSIQRAGEVLGLKCPLAGAYNIGDNWAASH